jgi:hypothetical protein
MVEMLRRPSLFFGWIVPLALLVGQLSTLAHSMAVAHDRCPEHGELVHRTARSPAPADAGGGMTRAAQAVVVAVTAIAGHGHEHCISFWSRRELVVSPPQPGVAVAPPPARAVRPIDAPVLGWRSVLLSFAPKTSPPQSI